MTCKTICLLYLACGGRNLSTLSTCNGNGRKEEESIIRGPEIPGRGGNPL